MTNTNPNFKNRQIEVSGMYFTSLDIPTTTDLTNGREKYSVSFPVAEVPQDILDLMPRRYASIMSGDWQLVSAMSYRKPMIFGVAPDHSDIAAARRYAENVGTPFDQMLRGTPATLTVDGFFNENLPDGFGLAISAVTVDPEALFWPSPEVPFNRRVSAQEGGDA